MMEKGKFCLIVGVMAIMFSGCRTATLVDLEQVRVPYKMDGSPHSKETVQKAILSGCNSRGWYAKVVGEDLIEADITVRENHVTVHIPFSDSTYSILYKDSEGLGYSERRKTINKSYHRWISFLDKSIQKALRTYE